MKKSCLHCEKEYEAKRPTSKFCSDNCRVKWNYKPENKKNGGLTTKNKIDIIYNKFMEMGKGNVVIQDLTKPTGEIKPQESPKTNYSAYVPPFEIKEPIEDYNSLKSKILKTSTLDEIKEVMSGVRLSVLSFRDKNELDAIAKEHSKDFYND